MTMPAGLVKLMTHAPGARSATVVASLSISGIVRSAKQIPPGPVVSCPSTPRASGTDSSTTRPSSRPTRIAENTKSAPSTASSRSVVARKGSSAPRSCASPRSTPAIRSMRPASRSCRTTSSNGSVSRLAISAP